MKAGVNGIFKSTGVEQAKKIGCNRQQRSMQQVGLHQILYSTQEVSRLWAIRRWCPCLLADIAAAGLKEGADADDLIAQELGVGDASQLSDTQERYKEKIRQKLEEVRTATGCLYPFCARRGVTTGHDSLPVLVCVQQARAAEEEKAARYREFSLGKLAYAKGDYPTSVQYFTAALDREGPFSPMGGEIQLWLALGYQVHSLPHSTCLTASVQAA